MPTLEQKQSNLSVGLWYVDKLKSPSGGESVYVRSDTMADDAGLMAQVQLVGAKATPEDLANAYLLAASKDLLEMLQKLTKEADAALGLITANGLSGGRELCKVIADSCKLQAEIWK